MHFQNESSHKVNVLPCKIHWNGQNDKIQSYFYTDSNGESQFRGRKLVPSKPFLPNDVGMNAFLVETCTNSQKQKPLCAINEITVWHHDRIDKDEERKLNLFKNLLCFNSFLATAYNPQNTSQ